MIEQCLSNKNESATVPKTKKFLGPCLLPKFFAKLLQYLFRLYVTNIVQSWTN